MELTEHSGNYLKGKSENSKPTHAPSTSRPIKLLTVQIETMSQAQSQGSREHAQAHMKQKLPALLSS